uniref:Uncharacterized protein n=1 Tax=Anopheles culicifacies TaxID=139723 RepID=A0A182MWC8_9DIPT
MTPEPNRSRFTAAASLAGTAIEWTIDNREVFGGVSEPSSGIVDRSKICKSDLALNGTYRLGSLEATLPREMVSRRKILSRSRDDLNLDQSYITQEEEEDVWYQKEKLYKPQVARLVHQTGMDWT